jgi:hypothetical protein
VKVGKTKWYDRMTIAINVVIRVPKYLLDVHGGKIWFNMDKDNTYVYPEVVDRDKFNIFPLPFVLDKEVCSWLDVHKSRLAIGTMYILPEVLALG